MGDTPISAMYFEMKIVLQAYWSGPTKWRCAEAPSIIISDRPPCHPAVN
jgi:hypothetical protein